MIYDQTVNPFKRDLLWGVSIVECATDENRKKNVGITMVHALAKVNIILDESLGNDIGSVIVSAYKTGRFPQTDGDGIPAWDVPDKTPIDATFYKYGDKKDKDLNEKNSVTVFILPEKITGLQVWNVAGKIKIADATAELQQPQYTFKAGKEYNLTISKGVQKKNTNSRSIAMSVRCVSE